MESASVRFVVGWTDAEEGQEYPIILPDVYFKAGTVRMPVKAEGGRGMGNGHSKKMSETERYQGGVFGPHESPADGGARLI